ncbi:MAG: ACT domain-containing protein [Acidimicrobiales bacterium]
MATYLVRVALPDRPGALGSVASRIGSVRGDVVAVEIVERAEGRAVDEFVLELPDEGLVPLLLAQIEEVDGATVEEFHPILDGNRDRRLDAYDSATSLLGERSPERVLDALTVLVRRELDGTWAAVVDVEERALVSSNGRPPAAPWLAAYASDCRLDNGDPEVTDIAWVELAAWDLFLVVGRPGWRFGQRERSRLDALARLADARWADLAERDARTSHPTCAS